MTTAPSTAPHTEVVRITPLDAATGEPAGDDAFGIVAWGTSDHQAILRCSSTLEQLQEIAGDLGDLRARYELAWCLAPHLGPPWPTRAFWTDDPQQRKALEALGVRYAPHREVLAAHVVEGCGPHSSARVVRIVEVDPQTGTEAGSARYGVWARGRFGPEISRWATSLTELATEVGDLTDERALWAAMQAESPSIGTWDGEPINPLDAWLEDAKRDAEEASPRSTD